MRGGEGDAGFGGVVYDGRVLGAFSASHHEWAIQSEEVRGWGLNVEGLLTSKLVEKIGRASGVGSAVPMQIPEAGPIIN
jgi:hypothetical protein